ncbi:LysE family translocator [Frankia sp. CNm7]|uniref:LysE family translocator n=1 Tax=Frankia nepalensis TaxID=1836974 RepID=A0A937UVT1_9ACTN|nr:LysE family translocator [Frankia nepalensis]MBL7501808.1 LysE family translocator [Frankia nepalensis]MBL7512328.1 LysE family translocator [Frankia nepalensis]MBL7523181.1 LysE family translocator [Frankia nepalensis]MBL7632626.1 LysE family translocator [Frankia nepalensis]
MIPGGNLAGFAAAAFVLIVVPGPSVLFVVGRALSLGRGPAIASVVGNALGNYTVAVLVAFGLGTLVERSAAAFLAVKLVGGVYLVWLGIQAIRHRHELAAASTARVEAMSRWRTVRQGFLVGITNPKALIMFGVVLPPFVSREAGQVPVQMLLMSLVAIGIGLVSDSGWAMAASAVRAWFTDSPRRLATVGGAGGLAMIGVGLHVALTNRRL